MIVLYFTWKGKRFRMRVAKVHVHPGDRDHIEMCFADMLNNESWAAIPDGSPLTPSPEWIVRRALWDAMAALTKADHLDLGDISI